ncbi:MAG: glycosyltransferase, partial [Micrococcales bacterium]|nr:glycosyltransferase [Micrococcales bacterium]
MGHEPADWTPVHRIVFPADGDTTLLPLYLDHGAAAPTPRMDSLVFGHQRLVTTMRDSLRAEIVGSHATEVRFERSALTVAPRHRISLATYFNAFPASYWQEHTDVDLVRLDLNVSGAARVDVFRSNARGKYVRIDSAEVDNGTASFEVALDRFGDGGWLWFDLEAHGAPATLTNATWSVPSGSSQRPRQRATVAIPSFNMPAACIDQINRFAEHPEVMDSLSRIVIIDQGTSRLRDHPRFEAAASRLGSRLLVIEQPNLGGSGGFSRGMLEMVKDASSDAVLLLDDDAEAEPESIIRAIRFSEFTRGPRIIGGHMLNSNERTVLHSFGETVNWDSFWWEAVDPELSAVDFRYSSIRATPALSRRMDVTYNGWWMCLIPREAIEKLGLSLPYFIKWDD